MRSRTISRREHLPRNNKSGGVWSEVLEKVAETVKGEQSTRGYDVKSKTDDTEKYSQDEETTNLNGFASDGVNCGH